MWLCNFYGKEEEKKKIEIVGKGKARATVETASETQKNMCVLLYIY
jgi:hypothetical protein